MGGVSLPSPRVARAAPSKRLLRMLGDERLVARYLHLRPSAGIVRIARALHARGDGWTALRLQPPTGSAGGVAVYGLFLRVTRRDAPEYKTGVKLIVDCQTGRFIRWLGPGGPST